MDAIVFAAGRGSRLQPLTDETPKPLLEVGGKPLLCRCLDAVAAAGVDRFVIVVGYKADAIVSEIGRSYAGRPVSYAFQRERQGLAHAVCRVGDDVYDSDLTAVPTTAEFPADHPDTVMTVNGDNLFQDCQLERVRNCYEEAGVDGTLLLDRVARNDATAKACCAVGEDGTIRSIETVIGGEADVGYVAGGVQIHDVRALIEACERVERADSGEYELTDALTSLVADSHYVGVELEGWHLNVNTPADLERARDRFENAES